MPRNKLSADARRSLTVQTVIALAAVNNPATITTAQIAQHMGVTQGALFRHFVDKQAIWVAVMDWTAVTLLARLDAVDGSTPVACLRAMFAAHIDFIVLNPGVPRIVFGELQQVGAAPGKAQALDLISEYRRRVVAQLEAAKAQGMADAAVDIPAAATMYLGMVQGLVMQAMAADDFTDMPAMSRRLVDLFLRSLESAS